MPEFYEHEDEAETEVDPATVAFLDQQEAQFAEERERFVELYGFDHECRCSEDYTEGHMAEVTQCFLKLTADSLARNFEATYELRVLGALVEELGKLSNDLMKLMMDLGHKDELESYLKLNHELDEQDTTELEEQLSIDDIESPSDADDSDDESEVDEQ